MGCPTKSWTQSPVYKDWYEKYQAHMEALRNPNEETYKKFQDFFYRMNNAIHIRFYITVNSVSYSIYFMKGGQQQLVIPGAAYAVKGSKTGALTGGGEEKAMDACLILFGNQKPVIKPEADGGASIYQENSFPKNTSHLTVQNITVRIECNDELLNRIIKETDWNAIHDMIAR
jgi:hypothetical protein